MSVTSRNDSEPYITLVRKKDMGNDLEISSIQKSYEEEWKKANAYFEEVRKKCKDFANVNIKVFWHFNNNVKRINHLGEVEFVNYDGEFGNGLLCKHCGKIMIARTGSYFVLGRLVRLMMRHLEKVHSIKMESYADSLRMYEIIKRRLSNQKMIMVDGIE